MKNIAKIVENELTPIVNEMGYDLYAVEYVKKQNGMNLTLFIDNLFGATTIDDCERVHRAVDTILDDLNPTGDVPYYLNVSSIGLDKPLTCEKDYRRNKGKLVDIKFFTPFESFNKELTGTLLDYDDQSLTIQTKAKQVLVPIKRIALCKLHLDF